MSRKQLIILALTGAFIVLMVIFGFLAKDGTLPGTSSPLPGFGGEASSEGTDGMMGGEQVFTPEVPANAVVTTPDVETPASQNGDARFGGFNMNVSSAGFIPNVLTVNLGDLVQINLTAVGGDYDFSMPWKGLYSAVRAGETKQISFQTTSSGTFLFECRDFCPFGRTIQGELIVTP